MTTGRIWQWCRAAGFNPAVERDRRISIYYARQMLALSKRDQARPAPLIMAAGRRAPPKRKRVAKAVQRAELDQGVIDFMKAGDKIKRLPPRKL